MQFSFKKSYPPFHSVIRNANCLLTMDSQTHAENAFTILLFETPKKFAHGDSKKNNKKKHTLFSIQNVFLFTK